MRLTYHCHLILQGLYGSRTDDAVQGLYDGVPGEYAQINYIVEEDQQGVDTDHGLLVWALLWTDEFN